MIPERPLLERRVLAALDASPPRVPVLLGGCGSGRTSTLLRLRDLLGATQAQYVDVERVATTPERLLRAIVSASPFPAPPYGPRPVGEASPRDALDATLALLNTSRTSTGGAATFLIDEVLEFRTFESFPGLRTVMRDLVDALSASPNRFVLTTRYVARALRLLRDAPAHFEVIHLPPLTVAEVGAALGRVGAATTGGEMARAIQTLTDGRPAYVTAMAETMTSLARHGPADPVSALAALLAPGGRLAATCRYCYELRLHRARGYGALKAILEVLAFEEPLTLTEVAIRLRRTPGSTKDYLSWLEDVDLVTVRQKRYSFADPLLRLWVRLHCRPAPPGDDDVAREVQTYALGRLPQPEPEMAVVGGAEGSRTTRWDVADVD